MKWLLLFMITSFLQQMVFLNTKTPVANITLFLQMADPTTAPRHLPALMQVQTIGLTHLFLCKNTIMLHGQDKIKTLINRPIKLKHQDQATATITIIVKLQTPLIVILPILLGIQTQAHHTTQETHGLHIPPGRAPNQSLSNQRKKSANNATVQATNNVGPAMALGR